MKKLIYVILAALIIFGCARKEGPKSQVVAKVGNRVITIEEFDKRFSSIPPVYQESIKYNKEVILDDLIAEEVLYKEALRKGLGADKEVKDLLQETKKKILVARLLKDEVEDKAVIQDKEIQDYYESNKDKFVSPEMFRASHILVGTLEEAVKIVDQLNSGADFEELAREYSVDVTNTRGGDVGYFTVGQMVPEFEDACVKLNVGEIISAPVKTQFGYHIIKLTDRKPSSPLEFSKVKERIWGSLSNNKKRKLFNNLVSNLKAKYKITKNLELLESPEEEVSEESGPSEE